MYIAETGGVKNKQLLGLGVGGSVNFAGGQEPGCACMPYLAAASYIYMKTLIARCSLTAYYKARRPA